MVPVERLRREIKVLVFDQYGTVVDMQKGLTEVVAPFLERKGWKGDAHRFVTWWRRTHFENSMIDSLCDRGHTPYREIGHRAVSHVMDRAGIAYTQDEVEWLVSQIEALKPFPDAREALQRLHRRYKLAILSNGDKDMLAAAKPYIDFAFDHTISVEEAESFQGMMAGTIRSYHRIDELVEPKLPVKYPRLPGRRPSTEENPYNAWYWKSEVKGKARGLLAGKTIVLKDNISLAGVPMMNGASVLEGYVPGFDATVVSRILDAGGEIAGKAVCEYYCLSGTSSTSATGPVHNPLKRGYSAGDSSSGSAALVAAGLGGRAVTRQ